MIGYIRSCCTWPSPKSTENLVLWSFFSSHRQSIVVVVIVLLICHVVFCTATCLDRLEKTFSWSWAILHPWSFSKTHIHFSVV